MIRKVGLVQVLQYSAEPTTPTTTKSYNDKADAQQAETEEAIFGHN
jgi:hypothetical protein